MASAGIPRRISVSARARWIQLVVATPLIVEVLMGRPAGWMVALTGRSAMKSPGAPSLRRGVQRAFWREIATSGQAGVAVGASQAAGSRWFREGGGMASIDSGPLSGRYLS